MCVAYAVLHVVEVSGALVGSFLNELAGVNVFHFVEPLGVSLPGHLFDESLLVSGHLAAHVNETGRRDITLYGVQRRKRG